jgi:hypothetical protein
MDSTVNPKVKTTEGKGVGARSLVRNILRIEGHAGVQRRGTRKSDKQVNYSHRPAQTKQQVD